MKDQKGITFSVFSIFFTFTSFTIKGFSTVRASLAHGWLGHNTCKTRLFWLDILLKIKPIDTKGYSFFFTCNNIRSPTYLFRSTFFCFFFSLGEKKTQHIFCVFCYFGSICLQKIRRNLFIRSKS